MSKEVHPGNSEESEISIGKTIEDRGERYGDWKNHAQISQDIQNAIIKGWFQRCDGKDFSELPAYMTEAITMIANKLGRVINGDPYYDDSWRDIAGYATLVVNELEKENAEKELQTSKEQPSV